MKLTKQPLRRQFKKGQILWQVFNSTFNGIYINKLYVKEIDKTDVSLGRRNEAYGFIRIYTTDSYGKPCEGNAKDFFRTKEEALIETKLRVFESINHHYSKITELVNKLVKVMDKEWD